MEIARRRKAEAVAIAASNSELPEICGSEPLVLFPTEEGLYEVKVLGLEIKGSSIALVMGAPVAIQQIITG